MSTIGEQRKFLQAVGEAYQAAQDLDVASDEELLSRTVAWLNKPITFGRYKNQKMTPSKLLMDKEYKYVKFLIQSIKTDVDKQWGDYMLKNIVKAKPQKDPKPSQAKKEEEAKEPSKKRKRATKDPKSGPPRDDEP